MFAAFFTNLDSDLQYRYYQVKQGELPSAADECDAYLITGSKAGVYDTDPWIASLQTWIADFHQQNAKLIGICFGHQIMAHSLGGAAAKSPKGWGIGVHSTTHLTGDELNTDRIETNLEDFKRSELSLLYSHQDQVQKLPPGAQLIARSDFCEYAAFKIDHRVLSFQGHPEFTPEYLQRLLHRRIDVIGQARYAKAMASLDKVTDEKAVGRQILEFVQRKC